MLDTLIAQLNDIATLAPTWGFVLVFVFMAIESSFIPFPSEIIMIPAGFFAARRELTTGIPWLDLMLAIVIGLAGSMVGAYFNYYLAKWLGEPFFRKYGKYFFVKPEALDRASEIFNKYGAPTTFVCRLVPVIRQLISLPAGLAKMPLGSFSLFTALGAGIWSAILAGVGYWIAITAGADISYADLVHRGKAFVDGNIVWVILGALAVVAAYYFSAKLAMGRRRS